MLNSRWREGEGIKKEEGIEEKRGRERVRMKGEGDRDKQSE